MNIFEQATRQAFRFESPKGFLTVEDLWNLPLTNNTGRANLDGINAGINCYAAFSGGRSMPSRMIKAITASIPAPESISVST